MIDYVTVVYTIYGLTKQNMENVCIVSRELDADFAEEAMAWIFYIYVMVFQAVRRAVNVLNVSTCI